MQSDYKLYIWVHAGLVHEWRAVQAAHCSAEMASKNNPVVKDWLSRCKTIVLLRARNTEELDSKWLELQAVFRGSKIPLADFNEDQRTLGGLKTACGVILPSHCSDPESNPNHDAVELLAKYNLDRDCFSNAVTFFTNLKEARTL